MQASDFTMEAGTGPATTFGCSHTAANGFTLKIQGKSLKLGDAAAKAKCGDCHLEHLRKTVISCAKCGGIIFPNDLVRCWLESDLVNNPHQATGKQVTFVDDNAQRYLGCMDLDCCLEGCSFSGIWDGEKLVSGASGQPEVVRAR